LCFVARLSPSLDGMTPDTIFSLFFKYFWNKRQFRQMPSFYFWGFSVPTWLHTFTGPPPCYTGRKWLWCLGRFTCLKWVNLPAATCARSISFFLGGFIQVPFQHHQVLYAAEVSRINTRDAYGFALVFFVLARASGSSDRLGKNRWPLSDTSVSLKGLRIWPVAIYKSGDRFKK
jgi:hypothetical protein